jgi:tetratricopeptide repeat protein
VVVEHAGDIHAMNGDTNKAIEYWKKALELGADKAVINRKIKLKKPF